MTLIDKILGLLLFAAAIVIYQLKLSLSKARDKAARSSAKAAMVAVDGEIKASYDATKERIKEYREMP